MKRVSSILLLVVAALCASGCGSCQKETDTTPPENPVAAPSVDYSMAQPGEVVELRSEEDFQKFVADSEIAAVKFGAEWCPPCKSLDPEYDKIAGYFQTPGVAFARVDVDRLGSLAQRLGVTGIPDTRIFYEGKQYTSVLGDEPQMIANVVDSMRRRPASHKNDEEKASENDAVVFDDNLPETEEEEENDFTLDVAPGETESLVSLDDCDLFLKEHQISVVKFGAVWCAPCRALESKLLLIAGRFKDSVAFAEVDVDESPELAKKYGVGSIPDTLVFRGETLRNRVVGNFPQKIMDMIEGVVAESDESQEKSADSKEAVDVASETEE